MKKSLYPAVFLLFLIMMFILSSCKSRQDPAAQAIEAYIQALSAKDSAQLSTLSCADWEQDALKELDSLAGVGSTVKDLACTQETKEGSDAYVSCTGTIVLDYNGEAQQIDLSTRTYIARQEAGEWRMCGYR